MGETGPVKGVQGSPQDKPLFVMVFLKFLNSYYSAVLCQLMISSVITAKRLIILPSFKI
jgi:hypothetical protein